jgi:hypothetical protein
VDADQAQNYKCVKFYFVPFFNNLESLTLFRLIFNLCQMGEVQGKMEKPVPTVDNEMHTRTGKLSDVKPPSPDGKYNCEAVNEFTIQTVIFFAF